MARPSREELRDAGVPEDALAVGKKLAEATEAVDAAKEEFQRVRDEAASLRDKAEERRQRAQRIQDDVEADALTPDYDPGAAAATKSKADALLEEAEELEPDVEAAREAWNAAQEERAGVAAEYIRGLAEAARAQLAAVVAGYEALVADDQPLIDVYGNDLRPALNRFNTIRDEIKRVRSMAGADSRYSTFKQKQRLRNYVEDPLQDPSREAVLGLLVADVLGWSRSQHGPWAELWREVGVDLVDRTVRRQIPHAEDSTLNQIDAGQFPLDTGL